ncbi:hypothetical protein BPORC_1828 [Bifidobacterium porcinum]|nr:hypothetical protein BPORC_1828 [Bifidobacterium porcinum]
MRRASPASCHPRPHFCRPRPIMPLRFPLLPAGTILRESSLGQYSGRPADEAQTRCCLLFHVRLLLATGHHQVPRRINRNPHLPSKQPDNVNMSTAKNRPEWMTKP